MRSPIRYFLRNPQLPYKFLTQVESDFERLVSEINAKTVVPIHTEHPELSTKCAKDVRIPQLGGILHL